MIDTDNNNNNTILACMPYLANVDIWIRLDKDISSYSEGSIMNKATNT